MEVPLLVINIDCSTQICLHDAISYYCSKRFQYPWHKLHVNSLAIEILNWLKSNDFFIVLLYGIWLAVCASVTHDELQNYIRTVSYPHIKLRGCT